MLWTKFKNKLTLSLVMVHKVTMVRIRSKPAQDVNEELQWLGNSLGLFNLRDKDSSCFRIFITLVKKSRGAEALSSDDIAEKLRLSRGTVVHHLTTLMEAGLVVKESEGYLLREATLERVVGDIHQDMEQMFAELKRIAKEIDEQLG